MQLKAGTILQNRYEILELIGCGGMSFVYKAKCHKLSRFVAIKVLKEEFTRDENFVYKFKLEAQAAAGLIHPNIVNVYDVIDEENLHYIVMEYIEGITLKDYINKRKILDIKEAISISIQVAKGIKAAHDANIIHRDIKPQNILIDKDGSIKVTDFGIARAISEETITQVAIGSVHYMSPEQAKGAKCDKRSDIYSLGITIYEMLTGRLPFEGDLTISVALAHLEEKMPCPSTYNPLISARLDNIILTCTRKNPDKRYMDISELIKDLENILLEDDFEVDNNKVEPSNQTKVLSASELNAINNKLKNSKNQIDDNFKKSYSKTSLKNNKENNINNYKTEKIITALGIAIALIMVIIIGFYLSFKFKIFDFSNHKKENTSIDNNYKIDSTKIKVPNIVGMNEDLAEKKLKELDLQLRVKRMEYDNYLEEGDIISQTPMEGEEINKYSNVEVIISKGKALVDISKLGIEGLNKESATKILNNNNILFKIIEQDDDNIPKDYVIKYEPKILEKDNILDLYISKGQREDMILMPDLNNHTLDDAIQIITNSNLVLGDVKEEYNSDYEKGKIISQNILKNTQVSKDTKIDLIVSKGKENIEPLKEYKYIASIDATYNIEGLIGPGSDSVSVSIMVRLRQVVNGENRYKTLMEPRKINGNTILPVRFKTIEGAYGVDQGYVEVVEASSSKVLKSYEVEFFKVE